MKRICMAALMLASITFISACGSPEEQIHKHLEETIVLEKDFEDQQKPLMELEQEEKALFDEIMSLGMKHFDKITSLSNEALANLDKREEHLAKEEEAMEASKNEFEKIDDVLDKMEDEKIQAKAKDLQDLMNKRFDAHGQLVSAYKDVIQEDRKMYEMLKDKELKHEDLEAQIVKSNEAQEKVLEANEKFNEYTKTFNAEKEKLYKEAGIGSE